VRLLPLQGGRIWRIHGVHYPQGPRQGLPGAAKASRELLEGCKGGGCRRAGEDDHCGWPCLDRAWSACRPRRPARANCNAKYGAKEAASGALNWEDLGISWYGDPASPLVATYFTVAVYVCWMCSGFAQLYGGMRCRLFKQPCSPCHPTLIPPSV
jgi:hypothetical protein